MAKINHYDYLDKHLPEFFSKMGINWNHCAGIIVAHGDKAYSYRDRWEEAGIPFHKGVAIFLLSYVAPYSKEVRDENGWINVDLSGWIIQNKDRFLPHLPD